MDILKCWTPCGLLDEPQQQRALDVAIQLLQHLHAHAARCDTARQTRINKKPQTDGKKKLGQMFLLPSLKHSSNVYNL